MRKGNLMAEAGVRGMWLVHDAAKGREASFPRASGRNADHMNPDQGDF